MHSIYNFRVLSDPWQRMTEPHTGLTFYYDGEFDVSSYEHPMVYECLAWETSTGKKFEGCTTKDTESPALMMLECFRKRYRIGVTSFNPRLAR